MAQVIVGKWGKNLAIRMPFSVVRTSGLSDGEQVEIEIHDGDIVIRRRAAQAQARSAAQAAAAEIIAESRAHSLGGTSIRELLDEGRRE